MRSHDAESALQRFADRHPVYFLPLHLVQGKLKSPEKPGAKANDIFTNAHYHENDDEVACIEHYGDLPVVEVYTEDQALRSRARTALTADYLMDFYLQYIQYLPVAARLQTYTFFTDPIKFTNNEIRRRKLDLSYLDQELHHMLKEYNGRIAEYNQTVQPSMQLNFFSLDELRALIVLCDVYKGIGCSAAVISEPQPDGSETKHLIRNLDWLPMNTLGDYSMATMTLTGHTDPDKPKAVFSIGITPGLLGLSLVNDRGLVITLNEATRMDTTRENDNLGAVPQFILTRQLIENCSTLADVKHYLMSHRPASSHILTVMDAEGSSGIFEMLPNKGSFDGSPYRFRGIDKSDAQQLSQFPTQHVTNHFLNLDGDGIKGTEACDSSFERYENMRKAIMEHKSPVDIAKSTSTDDTVQTLIFHESENNLCVDVNIANGFSAQAGAVNNQDAPYNHINLTETFAAFLAKCAEKKLKNQDVREVDTSLINLMIAARDKPGELGLALDQLYNTLVLELSLQYVQKSNLNEDQVRQLADATLKVVAHITDESIREYEACSKEIFAAAQGAPAPQEHAWLVSRLWHQASNKVAQSMYSTPGLTAFSRVSHALHKVPKEEPKQEVGSVARPPI